MVRCEVCVIVSLSHGETFIITVAFIRRHFNSSQLISLSILFSFLRFFGSAPNSVRCNCRQIAARRTLKRANRCHQRVSQQLAVEKEQKKTEKKRRWCFVEQLYNAVMFANTRTHMNTASLSHPAVSLLSKAGANKRFQQLESIACSAPNSSKGECHPNLHAHTCTYKRRCTPVRQEGGRRRWRVGGREPLLIRKRSVNASRSGQRVCAFDGRAGPLARRTVTRHPQAGSVAAVID